MNPFFACFITGTDTGIGKSLISAAMLQALSDAGVRAAGMKPVAAGAELRDGIWHNEDADLLADASSVSLPRELTTPVLLKEPAAPHIAAQLESAAIDPALLLKSYRKIAGLADAVVVEGVGGFRVPLTDGFDTADLVQQLGLPVVLVVGLRLGCLNHALLTVEAIAARGLTLAGWIGNRIDPAMTYVADNVDTLCRLLPAPLIGCVPHLPVPSPKVARQTLDFSCLPGWPGGPRFTEFEASESEASEFEAESEPKEP
jgi:dethiobiotin synthetase